MHCHGDGDGEVFSACRYFFAGQAAAEAASAADIALDGGAECPATGAEHDADIPYHVDQFFFGVITNGPEGIMPAFKDSISEEDRWNILNFLRHQFGQPLAER